MRAEIPSAAAARQHPTSPPVDRPSARLAQRPHRSRHLLSVLAITMLAVPVLVTEVVPAASAAPAPRTASTAPIVEEIVDTVAQLVSVTTPTTAVPATEAPTTESTTTEAPTTTVAPTTTAAPTTTEAPPTTAAPPPPAAPGIPSDAYWDRMAFCETSGDWGHYPNGTWTGGLGIYNQTWLGWGGGQFAPTAGQATREQQIIVANRIAVTGWNGNPPVGFDAWGCVDTIGLP